MSDTDDDRNPTPAADPDAITLWHVPLSRSMRVLWLLNEIGLRFDLKIMDMMSGEMRRGDYAAIHPVGRAPALRVDGTVIHESGAMIQYLCETRAPDLWRAPGAEGRLGWLDWLHFAETIAQHIANLTQGHVALRDPATRSETVMRLETARLARTLSLVDSTVADRDWLMESGFSGVDCAVGFSVWTAARFVRPTPALAAYAARCAARPAFIASLPREGDPVLYTRDFYELPDG